MADVPGDEQEALLERLLTRLALTEDSKLEIVLAKLLPFAISCLTRQSTRQKVMEMLTHINKRVKDQPFIKLPLLELLALYQSEESEPIVKSFALVYLEMSVDRHPKDDLDLAPELLKDLSQVASHQQDILLRMSAKDFEKYAFKSLEGSSAAKYTFLKNSMDRDIFLEFCLQTIIYQSSSRSSSSFPGLSSLQASRVSRKGQLKGDSLANRKVGMLNVISELSLPMEILYPLLLVASVDSNEIVSKRGEELLKRKAAGVNLDDPIVIKKLFSIFQGTIGNSIAEDTRISPASPAVKEKIMSVFTRSIAAANTFPATLHCIFDCIFGTDSFPRLKQSGMEFAVWVFKHARDEQMKPMAPIIFSGVLKILDNPPPSEGDTSTMKQLRMFAYQAIGLLGKRAPHLFRDNLAPVLRLFEAFKFEPISLKFTIQEALTSLASAYKVCSEAVAQEIISLLLLNVSSVEGEARFCSVWWANNLYKFSHCACRFVCMMGASDERLDVRDMALEGLLFPKHEDSAKADYPLLSEMLDFICKKQPGLLSPSKLGEQELFFCSKTYEAMITFLLRCYDVNEMRELFEERLLFVLEHAMASNGSIDLHIQSSNGLLMVASRAPKRFAEFYSGRTYWLRQYIGHIDGSTRETVAKLLGIVVSELSSCATTDLLGDLRTRYATGNKSRFEEMHGAICATGYILAQCSTGLPSVPQATFGLAVSSLVGVGNSGHMEIAGAVVEAIGHIGLRAPLQSVLDDGLYDSPDHEQADESLPLPTKMSSQKTLSASLTKIFSDVISSKDTKAAQKAIIAYGHMCFVNQDEDLIQEALDALLGLCRSKVEEVLFSVGEALCFIWGGLSVTADEILKTTYVSLCNASNFLSVHLEASDINIERTSEREFAYHERVKARDTIMHKLFDDLLYSSRKEERCAGAVWLVSIITYCGQHPRVRQILPDIQEALSHLLGEQHELTQEMASQGLSILYELGDSASRHELVKALVNTLSGTAKRKRAIKLTEDSEVFEEGTLGEKPGGGNITTYKELCSLANEMGQPDLIYKFMDLANYRASLNSKRGAAFGFARIAKQARDALCPYLPSLIPKLVRYQYDPNRFVQDAMGHIWRSLVPEPKKTINEFFDVIMEDLLLQAGSRLWRSREASCLALSDLLQGRQFQEVGNYLEKIWIVCFRAMDDVKETVRSSGVCLSRSISSLTIRLSDTQLTNQGEARSTLNIVLPILLSKGIVSNIADVQRLSINTVMKVAKNAGSSIRPQLPELIVCMLESLSSLEDQRLNYAELHAERAGISTERLESLRVAVARDSPMWETLHFCMQQIDEHVMEHLVPRLVQVVRSGVGLNTRVGVAKFISLLTQQLGLQMRKYAGVLLKVLKAVSQEEKSPASRQAIVSACASVAKYAGNTQLQSLFEDVIGLYDENTSNGKITSALLLRELSHQAHDAFVGFHSLVLPSAFIARFDDDKTVSNIFDEIWEENTSGQSIALQLYASEIVPLLIKGLGNTSWTQKKRCAMAITKLAETAGGPIAPHVQSLLKTLLDELSNRLWEGKEVLLDAINAICRNCGEEICESSDSNTINWHTISSAVLAACSKKKTKFRNAAFSCLEQILIHCHIQSVKEEAFAFLLRWCSQPCSSMEDDNDENETDKSYVTSLEKVLTCFKASIGGVSGPVLRSSFKAITTCLAEKLNGSYVWQVKLATLTTIRTLIKLVSKDEQDEAWMHIVKAMQLLLLAILECVGSVKVGQVRVTCLECMLAMLGHADFQANLVTNVGRTVSERLSLLSELEQNSSTKSLMDSVLGILSSDMART